MFAIPLRGAPTAGGIVVIAVQPERKRWWRAFRVPTGAQLVTRGRRQPVTGALVSGVDRRRALLDYLARFPISRRALGVAHDPTDDVLDALPVAVVVFRLSSVSSQRG